MANETEDVRPIGDAGPTADREPTTGRFTPGNKAALVTGAHSAAFWRAQEEARREIVRAVVEDAGHAPDDAPRALRLAADGIAQAVLLRDAAFQRVVESGGPMTSAGRVRRAYQVWLTA